MSLELARHPIHAEEGNSKGRGDVPRAWFLLRLKAFELPIPLGNVALNRGPCQFPGPLVVYPCD